MYLRLQVGITINLVQHSPECQIRHMKIEKQPGPISVLFLLMLLVSITGCANTNKLSKEPRMDYLVSTQWLSEHINDPDLVILDSSVFIVMDDGKMSSVSGKACVYSADNHVWAIRLWWMLRWAGLEQVSVLDGGLVAWKDEHRKLSTEPSNHTVKKFVLALRPELIADRDEVFNAISDEKVTLIDALPLASYKGDFAMYARPGHIPTATNRPSSDFIDGAGHFISLEELDRQQKGNRSQRTITYCGGGVAATGPAFNLHRLGFKDVAVYMGSLQEWAPNPENPMTTEETTN